MSQPNQLAHFKYRPEIDGLRAIAILSVFVFHLNHQWLPGGFVGVDIFFVLSGYLITSILYNDCKSDKFSFLRFYQRRIARIFPALFTVALAILAAAAFIYSPQDFASTGANLVAAALSVANVKYMLQGTYFEISPDAQPFVHYWSLSVEEQFYLIFPLLLFLIFRYARRHQLLILSLLFIVSFIACIVMTKLNHVWAFYLLPTRAWELCSGCILAVIPFSLSNHRKTLIYSFLPIIGLFLILSSLVLLNESPNFPGWQAILPVAGTVAIVLPFARNYYIDKWLSSFIMISIGRLSYSLYLWHWPVFSFVDYHFYLLTDGVRLALKISLSILLSLSTFYFIENPARNFLNQPRARRIAYSSLIVMLMICVPLGISIRRNNYVNADISDVAKGGLVFPGELGKPSIMLMGDSNGSMYGKVLKEICKELGNNLTVISVAAGDPLPTLTGVPGKLWIDSLEAVRKAKPEYLIIANHWSSKLSKEPDRLKIALDNLKPYVGHIILLNQPPILPKEASRAHIRKGGRPPFLENEGIRAERLKVNSFLLQLQSPNVTVVDISRYFETTNGEVLFLDEKGQQLYADSTHLSGYGAEKIRVAVKQALRPS